MRWSIAILLTTATSHAAPAPKECGASVTITKGDPSPTQITGTVKTITATKDEPNRFVIAVTTSTGTRTFGLYIAPAKPPFAVGDKIDANLRRGGGWHQVYDAMIKDGAGKVLLITSGSGADDWADGWKVTMGKVVESRQDPNQSKQSINRTHALDIARGKTKVSLRHCTIVQEGTDRFIASGMGSTWLGIRPPEGVDYQTFAMIRWP